MAQPNSRPYQVIRLQDDGEGFDVLASYSTYEAADDRLDHWWNRFPNACIEIKHGNLRYA